MGLPQKASSALGWQGHKGGLWHYDNLVASA